MTFIQELLRHSDASGSKSTILKPLTWFIGLCFALLATVLKIGVPLPILIMVCIFTGIAVLFFFFVYGYCLFTDKDALRSESYSIKKLQIEKGFVGDNSTGILELDTDNNIKIDTTNKSNEQA